MAITVAPLTTVVMSAVDRSHSGTASGINNAVARVGGVLAIAVLGIVMVSAFSRELHRLLPPLHLTPAVLNVIEANRIKLASLDLPGVDPQTQSVARGAIVQAFVFGFRIVMLICAALAIASSVVAAITIPRKLPPIQSGAIQAATRSSK